MALLPPIVGLGARRRQDSGRNGVIILAYTISTAILEVDSLLGAYRPDGISGSLEFIFRLMGLIRLVALVVFTGFWVQPGTAGPNAYDPDPRSASAPAAA